MTSATTTVRHASIHPSANRVGAAALEQLDSGAVVTNLKGRVTFWSYGLAALTGIPREDALGKRVRDVLTSNDTTPVELVLRLELPETDDDFEIVHSKTGEVQTLRFSAKPIVNAAGGLLGVTGLLQASEV